MRSPSLSQLVLTKLMVRQWNIGAASLCRRFFASSSDSGQIDRPANSGLERYPDGGPPRLLDREPIGSTAVSKAKRISRAMRAYLEKAKADKEFLEKELEEYNLGKRHLANMMGLNAAEMTQTDIDKAIEYLLPSGLTNLAAKPIMKHPKEVFPTPRAAQFGEDGRPHHFLFYTARPSFYQILFPVGSCRRALCTSAARVHKIRVAIIGAGPAGFYVASSLLKGLPNAHVSVYEKLPVPYGLIRYGVAPDHPEVKNCIHQFEKTVADFDARFAFFGNVQVGKDLEIKEIIDAHHITVLAYGSEKEKQLGIPGADAAQTKNYFSARTFVGWYNGVPWNSSVLPDLSRVETVIVLGHGNVALDVARILLLPLHLLKQTDITEHALAVLSQSRVKRVELIGRRGPLQVAFTIKELRELINLPETVSRFASKDVAEIASPDLIKQLSRPRQRLTQLLVDTAIKPLATKKSSDEREWALKFLRTPVEILRSDDGFAKDAAEFTIKCEHEEDRCFARMGKVDVPANQKLILGGTRWFSQEELEMHLLEHVKEEHYVQFVTAMDHLAKQPFAFLCGDFIMKFRKDVSAQKLATAAQNLPMLQHDQNGRLFAEAQGTRKDARAWVKLWGKGTGNIIMDGKEMDDLVFHQSRETLLFPFIFIGKLGQFDVDAVTEGGGESGKTGAVRLAVSRALCAFITPEEREKLRLGGLLTRDIRTRERLKQAPHKGARAKWRWKKR